WVLGALVSSIPFNFSWAGPVRIEGSVLLFTLGTLLVTTVSFGLASYWQTTRGGGFATAREEGMQTQTGASHGRVRSVLMTCEIALSFALLVGAALLGESLYRLYQEKLDRKSTRLNCSHLVISYAVFCLKKKKNREAGLLLRSARVVLCRSLSHHPDLASDCHLV